MELFITGDGLLGFLGAIVGVLGAYSLARWQNKNEVRVKFEVLLFKFEKCLSKYGEGLYIPKNPHLESDLQSLDDEAKEIFLAIDELAALLPSGIYNSYSYRKCQDYFYCFRQYFKTGLTNASAEYWRFVEDAEDNEIAVYHQTIIEINRLRKLNRSVIYRYYYKFRSIIIKDKKTYIVVNKSFILSDKDSKKK